MNLDFNNFGGGGPVAEEFGYVQDASYATNGSTPVLRTAALMNGGFQNGAYLGFASTDRTGIMGVWSDFTLAGDGTAAVIEIWQGDSFLTVRPVGTDLEVWTVNGGNVFTASAALDTPVSGTWQRVELKWRVSSLDAGNALNYDGMLELRVDEVVVGSASNIQLGFALPAGYTPRDVYWNVCVFNPHGDGAKYYLNNGAGSNNTDYMPANVNIYNKKALTGNGSFTELTPSTGTDQGAMVDDTAADGDTTYLSCVTAAMRSSFNMEDFSAIGSQQVYALKHVAHGKKTEAGFRRFRSMVYRNGIQQFASVDHPIGTGYFAWMQHIWELDPHTNKKWTIANINATEFGVLIG